MKRKIIIFILILIITIPLIANARYFEKIENIVGKAKIAEPIFKVENLQDAIIQTVNKESVIKEYVFKIKNFELENNGSSKRISQVDMLYNIEIDKRAANFPIQYELYEINSTENLLQDNKKTQDFKISKDLEYEKTYKLIANWQDREGILDADDIVEIKINATQEK